MDIIGIEKKINIFSSKLINYEDGDLMLLSGLIDDISDLNNMTGNIPDISKIFNIITNIIRDIISNKPVNMFVEKISAGIDIFSKIIKGMSGNQQINLKKNIVEKIQSYVEENLDFITRQSLNTPDIKQKNYSFNINSDLMNVFFTDTEERLLQAEDSILELEKDFNNKEIINTLFRIFHTIKGECGFLKVASLGEVTHNLENLLDLLRKEEIEINNDIIDIMLSGIDYSRSILTALKNGENIIFNGINIETFITRVNNKIKMARKAVGDILKDEGIISDSDVIKIMQKQKESGFTKKFGEIAIEELLVTEDEIKRTINKQKSVTENSSEKIDPVIKVKASQINFLVDMIGELLTIESQIDDKDRNILQLKKITKSIQNSAMQLRTVKIKNLFINTKRMARDVAKKLGKDIDIETFGDDLEIDRNLVEILEEPLLHIIRNSCHHGIEEKNERLNKNKNCTGKIRLMAERKGNNIIISVHDDGKGLDEDKIIAKALEKNLVTKEKLKSLSKNEIYNFIFLPGFSTIENVDNISGRGVGMDIVKNSVINARGQVEIKTEKDLFTEIRLVFPLSLAIIDGMIIRSKGNFYIVPVTNIIESLKLKAGMLLSVENKANVIHLRNEIIQVIYLDDFFNLSKKEINCNIAIIIQCEKKKYALLVDEIISKKEIVIKSLGTKFKNLRGISSCTVLPGGKIGFVLNIEEIISA